jgi:diaminohydroxyphosphoribosylaminopyrimidine deaminase / 5-amino-6-(5-phosphoribosylamino)uracil reductase
MLSSIWLFLPIHMADLHEAYMHRCIELAQLGAGFVAPNPMVGAVLVYENRIIGEGWHQQYGGAHAEVNCINSVKTTDRALIPFSTLYVSLEPCAHYGKTPPCTKLIMEQQIKKVVIGCRDPFEAVNGKGIEQLQNAGVEVMVNVLEKECIKLNRRFFGFHQLGRPYIILKWAQTADGYMASNKPERLLITHADTNRIVHQWRAEESAILVGTETALKDNPSLTNRLWYGKSPLRMVIDRKLRLPSSLHILNDGHPVIIFNEEKEGQEGTVTYVLVVKESSIITQILSYCYGKQIQSILVEGGAALLDSFLQEGYWDELRTITNLQLNTGLGLKAPELPSAPVSKTIRIGSDEIRFYYHDQSLAL